MLDREALIAYQERWKAVAAVEKAEQRQATPVERWQTLNALLRMAAAFGLKVEEDEEGVAEVRRRWNRLKDSYEGQPISQTGD